MKPTFPKRISWVTSYNSVLATLKEMPPKNVNLSFLIKLPNIMVYFLDVCGKKNSIQDRVWGKNVGAVRDLLDHPQEKFSANFMIWGGVSWKGLIPPNRPIFVDELKVSCFLQIDQFFKIGFTAIITAFPYSKLSYPIG